MKLLGQSGSPDWPSEVGTLKRIIGNIITALIFIAGLAVLLYPTISDYYNSLLQGQAITMYDETLSTMSEEDYSAMLEQAASYNRELASSSAMDWRLSDSDLSMYHSLLNPLNGSYGMMGHIEIEKLGVDLPIYHTVEDTVLQVGVGHIPGSSLPIGGEGTHSVLSGHRGLPTSKLFTELDKMQEGDLFFLHILNEQLAYEVDQIRVVLPDQVSELKIEEGKDLCTLVTCTPYAINSHRLLVRGHRIDYQGAVYVSADAVQMDRVLVSSVIATPLLMALLAYVLVRTSQRRARRKLGEITPEMVKEAIREGKV